MPNPWFRLYDEVVDDPKVQLLSDRLFKAWINFMCIANKGTPRGTLPEIKQIAYRLHVTPIRAEALAGELVAAGLFEWKDGFLYAHNWNGRQFQSDDSDKKNQGKYVYLIKAPDSRITKVGFSKNPWARIVDIRSETDSSTLEVIATFKSTSTSEAELHVLLSDYHHQREWFEIPIRLLTVLVAASQAKTTYEGLLDQLRSKHDELLRSKPGDRTTTTDQIQNRTESETEADKKESLSEIPKKSKRAPRDFMVSDANRLWAIARGFNDSVITEETAAFLDHEYKTPRSDWPAAWRNWLRNKDKFQGNGNGKQNIETRGELLIRRQKEELDRALGGATGDGFGSDDPGRAGALVRSRTIGSDG